METILNKIATETEGNLICGGDLNMILEQKLDTTSPKRSDTHLSKLTKVTLREVGMTDTWHYLHPNKK